jgi:predicted regulator of Ras-like GTPase activity (Roadblock/LC7/MglB family)
LTRDHLTLSTRQLHSIADCLHRIRREGQAHFVLLADITGQLIEIEGDSGTIDPPVLAALAAGEVSATREIARLMNEVPGFKMILHEGRQQNIYLSEVDEELVLAVLFNKKIPIGMVRLMTQMTVDQLHQILAEPVDEADVIWSTRASEMEFERLLASELDMLWQPGE